MTMKSSRPDNILTTIDTENDAVQVETKLVSPNTAQAQLKKRVHRLLKQKENKHCVDCSKPNPRWITILSVPPPYANNNVRSTDVFHLGGLCCLECSGAHRRLGTHISFVRSIELDSLKGTDCIALENGGNDVVNNIFEGKLGDTRSVSSVGNCSANTTTLKPDPNSTQKAREVYIRNKYEKKQYIDIKALTLFRQSMLNNMRNGFSLGDATSPTAKVNSPASSTSSSVTATSTVKLQVFTSSPRTLAMIEKYMNPKPKKQGIGRRIRNSLRRRGPRSSKKRYLKKSLQELRGIVNVNPSVNIVETRSEYFDNCDSDCGDDFDDSASVTSTRSSMSAFLRRRHVSERKIRKYQQINKKARSSNTPKKIETKKRRFRIKRNKKQTKNNNKAQNDNPTEEELEAFGVNNDENTIPTTPKSFVPKSPRFRLTPYLRTPKRENRMKNQKHKADDNGNNKCTTTQVLATRDCNNEDNRPLDDELERDCHEHLEEDDDDDDESSLVEQGSIREMKAWSATIDGILIKMKKKFQSSNLNENSRLRKKIVFYELDDDGSNYLKSVTM